MSELNINVQTAPVVLENFSGPSGASLLSRPMDSGHNWIKESSIGDFRSSGTDTGYVTASGTVFTVENYETPDDFDISFELQRMNEIKNDIRCMFFFGGLGEMCLFGYMRAVEQWQISHNTGGTSQVLAFAAATSGTTVRLEVRKRIANLFIDDVQVVTDLELPDVPGRGIGLVGSTSQNTAVRGIHYARFSVVDRTPPPSTGGGECIIGSIKPLDYGFLVENAPAAVFREAGTSVLQYRESDTPEAWEITGLDGGKSYEAAALTTKLTLFETTGAPLWHPDVFTDQLMIAYDPREMTGDPVAWKPKGIRRDAALTEQAAKRPSIVDGGMVFTRNQFLLRNGTTFGAIEYRGFIILAKVNDPTGTGQVHICTINAAGGDYDTPCIRYKAGKLEVRWDAPEFDGTTISNIKPHNVIVDGFVADNQTWNVIVVGRHDSYTFARLNGTLAIGPDRPWSSNNMTQGKTIIGPRADQGDTTGVTIGYLAGFQGELPESWFRKAEDWAAVEFGMAPFHGTKAPILEDSDFPTVLRPNKPAWDTWFAANPKNASKLRQYCGQPALPLTDYTPVYLEDFRRNSLGGGAMVNKFAPTIYAQGGNPAVSGDTFNPFLEDAGSPVYEHDAVNQKMLIHFAHYLNEKDRKNGKTLPTWNAAALTSLTASAYGRAWKGGYVLRFRDQYGTDAVKKLFYGRGWVYGINQRRYEHLPRWEYDFNEPDAVNRIWGNMFSVHVHDPFISTGEKADWHHKMIAQELTPANGWPTVLDQWNGQVMDWEIRVDPDYTYLNLRFVEGQDFNDRTGMIEWARFRTPPGFTDDHFYFMFNTCSKIGGDWEPVDKTKKYSVAMEYIQVLQRNDLLAQLPSAFTAKPVLTRSNGVLRVDPKLKQPLNFVEYIWSGADGYQHDVTRSPEIPDIPGVSKVLIRALGAKDLPEAWSNKLTA